MTAAIGAKFAQYVNGFKIEPANAPVLAATRNSGSNAIGQPVVKTKRDLTARLAEAVSDFYFAFESGNQKSAIEEVHKVILELQGRLLGKSYHQCVAAHDLKPDEWRPEALHILRMLRYDPEVFPDAEAWHGRAKELLAPYLAAEGVFLPDSRARWMVIPVLGLAHGLPFAAFPALTLVLARLHQR